MQTAGHAVVFMPANVERLHGWMWRRQILVTSISGLKSIESLTLYPRKHSRPEDRLADPPKSKSICYSSRPLASATATTRREVMIRVRKVTSHDMPTTYIDPRVYLFHIRLDFDTLTSVVLRDLLHRK
jgi:hypothetical protein